MDIVYFPFNLEPTTDQQDGNTEDDRMETTGDRTIQERINYFW
jgi:hypothetical protein